MAEFDRGPSAAFAAFLDGVRDPAVPDDLWLVWGPVFYRGRLDGSARVLCVASDPGPTERIAGRGLVGDAGQRVQGLLAKLGLTRSCVCLNAWAYAVHPGRAQNERERLDEPVELAWRNERCDRATSGRLRAVIAFGGMAQRAVGLWSSRPDVPVSEVAHPCGRDETRLLDEWRAAASELRAIVTLDADGDDGGPSYATGFAEGDYEAIARRDLPFGAPAFVGDDAWVRVESGGAQSLVSRPSPDDGHTLTWRAPRS